MLSFAMLSISLSTSTALMTLSSSARFITLPRSSSYLTATLPFLNNSDAFTSTVASDMFFALYDSL